MAPKGKSASSVPAFFSKLCSEMECAVQACDLGESINTKILLEDPYLNWSIGGGLVRGRLNVLAGQSGSGKSYLSAKAAATIQQEDNEGWVLWLDTEYYLYKQPERIARLAKMGIDLKRCIIISSNQTNVVFSKLDEIENALKAKDIRVCVMVIDSLGALEDQHAAKKFAEGEIEDASNKYGGNAKAIGTLVRKLLRMAAENDMTTICVQHAIVEQGNGQSKGPPKYVVKGGNTLRLQSDLFILMETVERKDALITADNESVEWTDKGVIAAGKTIRYKCLKSRYCMEGRTAESKINFVDCKTVQLEGSLCNLAKLLGVIVHPVNPQTGKENAQWWCLKDEPETKWNGEKQVIAALADKTLYNKVHQQCLSATDTPSGYCPSDVTIDMD